jgi:tRNA threonylcarbamoyladenosine biosynthesis protein TsaB
MNILAIDTTSPFFSIAYRATGKEDYYYQDAKQGQHAESLLQHINTLITDFTTLDCLMISRGPGSFTGLRIGLSIAKAFKIALPSLNIMTPTQFQLVAFEYFTHIANQKSDLATIIIDAKRGEVAMQQINANLSEANQMINIQAAELIVEKEQRIVIDSKSIASIAPESKLIEHVGAKQMLQAFKILQKLDGQSNFDPLYFRPSDAQLGKIQSSN